MELWNVTLISVGFPRFLRLRVFVLISFHFAPAQLNEGKSIENTYLIESTGLTILLSSLLRSERESWR